jgi:hypothetical protein
MEYRHKGSSEPKKLKSHFLLAKVMHNAFWDVSGVVHLQLMPAGAIINSERYSGTLQTLKAQI